MLHAPLKFPVTIHDTGHTVHSWLFRRSWDLPFCVWIVL